MYHIKSTSRKKHKCTVNLFCKIHEKWNHSTLQCIKNPKNCKWDKTLGAVDGMFQDEDGDEGDA